MKVIQITGSNLEQYPGIIALTNTGNLFLYDVGSWKELPLPPGCVTGPPPIPEHAKRASEVWEEQISPPIETPQATAEVSERKVNLAALPPSLRALHESGSTRPGMCPTCGLPTKGGTCLECAITPAGGGNYDIE